MKFAMNRFLFLLVFLISFSGHCQLSGFDFGITPVDETCSGSGSLTFVPSNVPDGAEVTYYVYLHPNVSVPVQTTSGLSVADLPSGDYTVIASITLNGEEVSVSHEVTVNDLRPPTPVFEFEIQSQDCNNLNQINVLVTSGGATAYEIFSGPVTAPPQTSSLFTGLVSGQYIFRVYDGCGQAVSQTYTAVFNPQSPVVSGPIVDELFNGNCSSFTLANTIAYPEGTIVTYPLTVQYTLHSSDGSPDVVISQVINSGDISSVDVSNTFPYAAGVSYTYDVTIVNGCGTTFSTNGNVVNPVPTAVLTPVPTPCGEFYLSLGAAGYNPPYNVTFTAAPAGFNPSTFNTFYPGPYTNSTVVFGGMTFPVPEGEYKAYITDACGRQSDVAVVNVENVVPDPSVTKLNNGCFSNLGRMTISIPLRRIVFAEIISAPSAYPDPLPDDVTEFINSNGVLQLIDIPIGQYVINITDDCGKQYTVTDTVPDFVAKDFTAVSKPDCTEGFGTVAVTSPNGRLVSLAITSGPSSFSMPLPYDLTSFILPSNGRVYLDNLPVGQYTFSGTDSCGVSSIVSVVVVSNTSAAIPYTFDPLCNSFNLTLNDPDPENTGATYWLQLEDSSNPGVWTNPATGAVYTEGSVPDATTGIALSNSTVNYNLVYSGNLRVMKVFSTYGAGILSKNCISQLGDTFEYYYTVVINNIYSVDCAANPGSVYVEATGLAPLHYSIVDPNNDAITLIDNGTNPVFANLLSGSYKFKVENTCGEIRFRQADVSTLPDLVNAATPPNLAVCVPSGTSINIPVDLTAQNTTILNGSIASQYSITYFTSYEDADSGSNPITNPQEYMLTSNPQTVYAKLNQIYVNLCPDIVSFSVRIGATPELLVDEQQFLCEEIGELEITADAGFDSYLWLPGGETTQSITVTTPGVYSVTVFSNGCSSTKDITVIPVEQPVIDEIETFDWTYDQNGFTVVTPIPAMYLYSIDGVNYQESNTFTGLNAGIYTVYVKDRQACTAAEKRVTLLYYPKFFTPNGDGFNETWRIEYQFMEPNLTVYIYDRYGKLITGFPSQSLGWDGTLNGHPLPATDYWFVVTRQDGRVHKGHFSLIR